MSVSQQLKKQIVTLLEYSQAMGVLKCVNDSLFINFKLAFHPFVSTRKYHQKLSKLQLIWQKLFFKLSNDREALLKLLEPLALYDELLSRILNIYKKQVGPEKDGINFVRCDYYNDQNGDPKITQYNLMSIGMQSNMQQFQQAKQITDHANSHLYIDSASIKNFALTVKDYYTRKKVKGLFLIVHLGYEMNFLDQKRFEILINKQGIRTKRATFSQMAQHLRKSQDGTLYFYEEQVSVVYYRGGYKLEHFVIGEDKQSCWKVKEDISLSKAIAIPNISMELVNLKRVQTELNKPDVLSKYISSQECQILLKARVHQWQFDTIKTQQFQQLMKKITASPQDYILKPNREGGGNNYHNQEMIQLLNKLSAEERRAYILMQKIKSTPIKNIRFYGSQIQLMNCLYEISRYGSLNWFDGELNINEVSGFLIRAKPEGFNEGGIAMNIGAIVSWRLQDQLYD